jgi:two-component system, response regulator / RNA-binding antiterminator
VTAQFEAIRLRTLIAAEEHAELQLLVDALTALGHEVIAQEVSIDEVAAATARALPDVALVRLGLSTEHALDLIAEIVHEAACPVIAMLSVKNAEYVREAAKRGIFASVFHEDVDELRDAIEISLRRFDDYHNLQAAFARRASIEQAKGILMARNEMSADEAFASLRDQSAQSGTKIVEVATAVIESHGLFVPGTPSEDTASAMT